MIELQAVTKQFQRGSAPPVAALRGVDMSLARGELVAIRGASGSGKSTLLNILGCLEAPTTGSFRLDGQDVAAAGDRRRSRLRARAIGFVFQAFHLLPRTTALENVEMPALYWPGTRSRADIRRRACAALEQVGLGHRLRHYPHELSGGEQQRVAVARAVINDPALILADEPTGNLDAASGAEVMRLLLALHAEGRTVVLVTHDEAVAALAPRQVVLRDGRIAADSGEGA
ncbi:MAG TPA: ABC transporter ATP-binding protein [Terriglobales bacterium]|jgi:putative ABC transport system ATP-binding protein